MEKMDIECRRVYLETTKRLLEDDIKVYREVGFITIFPMIRLWWTNYKLNKLPPKDDQTKTHNRSVHIKEN